MNTSGCQSNEARHPKASAREAPRAGRPRRARVTTPAMASLRWGARACPEGAYGADEGPCRRGEQREGDEVDVEVVAMQGGAGVDGVADERVDRVALDAVDRGRVARQREVVGGVGQRDHGEVAAREHGDQGAGVRRAAGMELSGL